jgi:hypothetical protein
MTSLRMISFGFLDDRAGFDGLAFSFIFFSTNKHCWLCSHYPVFGGERGGFSGSRWDYKSLRRRKFAVNVLPWSSWSGCSFATRMICKKMFRLHVMYCTVRIVESFNDRTSPMQNFISSFTYVCAFPGVCGLASYCSFLSIYVAFSIYVLYIPHLHEPSHNHHSVTYKTRFDVLLHCRASLDHYIIISSSDAFFKVLSLRCFYIAVVVFFKIEGQTFSTHTDFAWRN